jgi:hypothetical protein
MASTVKRIKLLHVVTRNLEGGSPNTGPTSLQPATSQKEITFLLSGNYGNEGKGNYGKRTNQRKSGSQLDEGKHCSQCKHRNQCTNCNYAKGNNGEQGNYGTVKTLTKTTIWASITLGHVRLGYAGLWKARVGKARQRLVRRGWAGRGQPRCMFRTQNQ